MKIRRIPNNNNQPNFGAKLLYAGIEARNLLNDTHSYSKDFCKNVLDKFEHYMPEHTVEISMGKNNIAKNKWPPMP